MANRGPLVTAAVVVLGLAGFLVVNSVGGREAASNTAVPSQVAGTSVLATTEAPAQPTTTAPAAPTPAAPAAPAPAFPAEVVYAGRASTPRLAIAVAVKGDQAAAYLCDGRSAEAWLRGSAARGRVELSTKDGASRLTAALNGTGLTGVAVVGSREYPFTIGVATPPAGLYRGSDGSTTIGWIVLPDGSQVGIATTGATSAAAPELDPRHPAVTVGGRQIGATEVSGDTTFE